MHLAYILLKNYSERFWKIPKKTPLKKSCFDDVTDSMPEILQKRSLNEYVFLQILRIFQNNFLPQKRFKTTYFWSVFIV